MSYKGPKEEVKNQWADRPLTTATREKETSGTEKIRKKNKSPMNWFGKNLCQTSKQAHKGIRRNKENPKAPTPLHRR